MTIPFLVAMWTNPTTGTTYNRPSTSAAASGTVPSNVQTDLVLTQTGWIAPAANTTPANAYDTPAGGQNTLDPTSTGTGSGFTGPVAQITSSNTKASGIIYSGFAGAGLSGTLKIQVTSYSNEVFGPVNSDATSSCAWYYSTNSGSTWTQIFQDSSLSGSYVDHSTSTTISGLSSQANLQVLFACNTQESFYSTGDRTSATSGVKVYDIVFIA